MDACTLRTNTNAYFSLRPCVEALGAVPVGFLSVELHTTSAYSGLMVLTPSPGVMRDKLRSRRPPAGEGACPPPTIGYAGNKTLKNKAEIVRSFGDAIAPVRSGSVSRR